MMGSLHVLSCLPIFSLRNFEALLMLHLETGADFSFLFLVLMGLL